MCAMMPAGAANRTYIFGEQLVRSDVATTIPAVTSCSTTYINIVITRLLLLFTGEFYNDCIRVVPDLMPPCVMANTNYRKRGRVAVYSIVVVHIIL